MPSPIEKMIDAACGVAPGDFVTLRCSKCEKEMRARKDDTDPLGTVVVEIQCPDCNSGDFDSPVYFDADGLEIPFEE